MPYPASRLAWFYVKGVWPNGVIDHINGNPLDDRINNLRDCTTTQNLFNTRKSKNRSSKFKGVTWDKIKKKWAVYITINHKQQRIGIFEDELKAAKFYDKAAIKYYGEFAKTNKMQVLLA